MSCLSTHCYLVSWHLYTWVHFFARREIPTNKYIYIYIYIYAFSRRFYPKRLTVHSSYSFYILSALAFPGNRTHDLGVASAMLYQLSYRKAIALQYISLQFPKETNTRGNSDAFYSFSHKFTEFLLKMHNFHTITWWKSCYDFKTILICWELWKLMLLNVSIAHIQPHI